MSVCERFYKVAEEIWESYNDHPFIKGITDGTLEIEKFRHYMIQDYIYLLDYAKVFALGITKAGHDVATMQSFAKSIDVILNGEMTIHRAYMARLGITEEEVANAKMSIDNYSYVSYMIAQGSMGGVAEVYAAILSCAWSYEFIAKKIVEINPKSVDHEFYGEWVRGYSSDEYADGNVRIFAAVEKACEGLSDEHIEALCEMFRVCSVYEYNFWDMAYYVK